MGHGVGVWQWVWLDCWYFYEAHLAAIIQLPCSIKAWLHPTPGPNYFRRQLARVPRHPLDSDAGSLVVAIPVRGADSLVRPLPPLHASVFFAEQPHGQSSYYAAHRSSFGRCACITDHPPASPVPLGFPSNHHREPYIPTPARYAGEKSGNYRIFKVVLYRNRDNRGMGSQTETH
ncbi:hypothetical protein COCON_G00049000 [Conger conger]|uniref:Uncharacterized protein n=1 Tax=Conger conger TaxID=82655 RepID=A0A9Q1DV39_CONCO|nr:hypothetical protein COCON_G00049000 [Conger conger]